MNEATVLPIFIVTFAAWLCCIVYAAWKGWRRKGMSLEDHLNNLNIAQGACGISFILSIVLIVLGRLSN